MNNRKISGIGSCILTLALFSGAASADWGVVETIDGGVLINSWGECVTDVHGVKRPDRCGGEVIDGDADQDGVPDSKDQCKSHMHSRVDSRGCEMDADNDGVIDFHDSCAGTPAGASVNRYGCMSKIVLDNVLFDTNKAVLTPGAQATLNDVSDTLRSRSDINSLLVTGHTDSDGDAAYNQKLSERRAQAVADYLSSHGVKATIGVNGMGESSPVASNDTAAGKARNRRVEIDIK